ncbi:DUF6660 family protein [Sphingobacterium spiritivorum]|uniref:DUF6660 family protein n=1 Tax=Sphingobacterium spiritivorum TaxID=258 RepID=UPI003687EBE3
MRILAYILSIYFILLTLIPCQDNHSVLPNIDQLSNEISAHRHIDQNGKHAHKDSCSPLCVCGCCSIAVHLPDYIDFAFELLPVHQDKSFAHHLSFYANEYNSIWQPPKLS